MPEPRRQRNVRPGIASARSLLGILTYRGASPEAIAAARADLEAAKARYAIAELLDLPDPVRAELALLLLRGAVDNAAA